MPKGCFPKLKGAICNIPVETNGIVNILAGGADSNGLIFVKLKRKLSFCGHVYLEALSPEAVQLILMLLKQNNPFYHDKRIDIDNISDELLDLTEDRDQEIPMCVESNEEGENSLDSYLFNSEETMLISQVPTSEQISIAPLEGKKPISILQDKYCEELAFPHIFSNGQFGYRVEREAKLSPVKYFNQRLLNYTQLFMSDSDYIFFALSVTRQLKLNSQINIAIKKLCGRNLNAGMFSGKFTETVKSFISKDEAYNFMSSIKGTPAYWEKFLFQVLGMVKQIGLATICMTLSCADLQWDELISIIGKLKGEKLSSERISSMGYFERCSYLNFNPVLLARQYQYRVEAFFQTILLNGPLGRVKYYAIRVEFQVCGSPHIHFFLWILNAPVLNKDNIQEYITFVDGIVKANVPDINKNEEFFNMVTAY